MGSMYLGPVAFKEIYKPLPWGGRALARLAGKRLPPRLPIGESWELADHPNGMSVVRGGPLAGATLRELMERHAPSLLGRQDGGRRFPLLVKLLDARDRVSVQVHPDDRIAGLIGEQFGKTEAWYVLEARRGAEIVAGLKSREDAVRLRRLGRSPGLASRLRVVRPRSGEAFLCPAGAVHSLGPALTVLEVQQNSDMTFRLFEWGRVGLDGKPRELHVEKAVRAVGGKAISVRKARPRPLRNSAFPAERLISCGKFVMDRWSVRDSAWRRKNANFEILYVAQGGGVLRAEHWPAIRLTRGATILVPACVDEYQILAPRRLVIVRMAEPE